MANIPGIAQWVEAIYQFSEDDPVQGGPGGIDNLPLSQLSDRTEYLKQLVDGMQISSMVFPSVTDAQNAINNGTVPIGALFNVMSSNDNTIFDIYQNINYVATFTGKSAPSAKAVEYVTLLSVLAYVGNQNDGFHASQADVISEGENFHFAFSDTVGKTLLALLLNGKLKTFVDIMFSNAVNSLGAREDKMGFINDDVVTMGMHSGTPFVGESEFLPHNDSAFLLADKSGQPFIDVAFNAGVSLGGIEITETNLVAGLAIVDKEGKILLQNDKMGEWDFNGKGNALVREFVPSIAETNHILVHGQSLSIGAGSSAISLTPSIYDCLMPNKGVADGPTDNGELTGPPIKSDGFARMDGSVATNRREFPTYGICNQIKHMMPTGFSVLGSNSGHGAYAINQLDKEGTNGTPTPNYLLGVQQVEAYAGFSANQNKSFLTQAMVWIQGESDVSSSTSRVEYKRRLSNLIHDFNNDISQTYTCCLMTYQTGSHTIRSPGHTADVPIAQWELQKESPLVFMACPTYLFTYNDDGVHMPANSYRWLGCYIGKALSHLLTHGEWRPLEPVRINRNRNVILVDFYVPSPPLVLDTERVTNPGDYGFEVWSGNSRLTISAISLLRESQVKIITNEIPLEPVTVKYGIGITGQKAGPITGPRGNLRDSDVTVGYETNTLTGQPYELFNWCPIFDLKEGM